MMIASSRCFSYCGSMNNIKIDDIDRRILDIIQTEGRLPNARIAERVGAEGRLPLTSGSDS